MIDWLVSIPVVIWIIAGIVIFGMPALIIYVKHNFEITELSGGPPWIKFTRKGKKAAENIPDQKPSEQVISQVGRMNILSRDINANNIGGTQISHAENIIIQTQDAMSHQKAEDKRAHQFHNLPQPDYSRFVGREQEIKNVLDILRPYPHSQYPIVTIDGIGGIGKSALALEIANRFLYNEGIPDGENFDVIIWASAKTKLLTTDGIQVRKQALRTLDDIYTTIAIVLRSEDITRARQDEQAEVVRRALTQQRTLLIVDNLETVKEEAVINFLRELPAPTKALVTTRHRIDVAYPIRLLDLPWEDAKALIIQECLRKDVTLTDIDKEELYKRTRGVPIAIVWSIGKMGFGHPIKDVLLKLEKPDSDISRFCFDESVNLIRGRSAHKLLMALSLFPSGITRQDLMHMTGLSEDVSNDALVILEKLSLVNKHGESFSMLPLTRNYVLSDLDKDRTFAYAILNKWIDYLSESLSPVTHRYWIQDQEAIMKEGENFLSIFDWSLAHQKEEIALNIIKYLILYLQYVGRRAEALKLAEFGIGLAEEYKYISLGAWLSVDAGWIHNQQGSNDLAISRIQKAVELYRQVNDEIGVIFANGFLAQALRHDKQLSKGEELLRNVVEKSLESGYSEGAAIAYFELGKISRERNDWKAAYDYFSKSITNLPQVDYSPDIFTLAIQGNMGTSALQLGQINEAKDITVQVIKNLDVWRAFGLASKFTARMYLQEAEIEQRLGNIGAALEYSEKALEISKTTKDDSGITSANKMLKKLKGSAK